MSICGLQGCCEVSPNNQLLATRSLGQLEQMYIVLWVSINRRQTCYLYFFLYLHHIYCNRMNHLVLFQISVDNIRSAYIL